MGTNYYALLDVCSECGRHREKVHLCKISVGWLPLIELHESNDTDQEYKYYSNWKEFKDFLNQDNVVIENEYEEEIDPETLIQKITDRYNKSDEKMRSHLDTDEMNMSSGRKQAYENNHFEIQGKEFSTNRFS